MNKCDRRTDLVKNISLLFPVKPRPSVFLSSVSLRGGMHRDVSSKRGEAKGAVKKGNEITTYICISQEETHAVQLKQQETAVRLLKRGNYFHEDRLYCWKKQRSFQTHCFSRLCNTQGRTKLVMR